MKTTIILMSIFIFSFIIGYTWSNYLVYKNGFEGRKLDKRKITVARYLSRTRIAVGNFFLMTLVTCVSLLIIGDSFFSFKPISVFSLGIGFSIMLVTDDLWFYIIHRIMHAVPFLYRRIHSVHHKAIPPIPMDYLYAHPIEAMGASMGFVWGMLVIILFIGQVSIYVFAAYAFYRTMHELCIHSGLVVIPEKWLGILASSRHHHEHHTHLNGNYAAGLTYLDKVFGTEIRTPIAPWQGNRGEWAFDNPSKHIFIILNNIR